MNPSHFYKHNVIDTCAIWNLLSSTTFYGTSRAAGCTYVCTQFVVYECLYKHRLARPSKQDEELRERFRKEHDSGIIPSHKISIQDLQAIEILSKRKRIGKGELSAIVFALRTRQAFLSDDNGAIKLALTELDLNLVQSTSLLFGWLFFNGQLMDHQKEQIILELEDHGRYMRKHYEEAYHRALQYRIMDLGSSND
jgi:predicted nucleic acid-binding protein